MNITLINPLDREGINGTFPSLGLGYIAAILQKNGYFVNYIDILDFDKEHLQKILLKITPRVIGITCNSPTFGLARKLGKLVRECLPNSLIILGGPHISIYPQESIANPEFDFGIYGEGEETIIELIEALNNKESFNRIDGLIYKENGNIIVNPPRNLINDLNKIPFPSRDLMNNKLYQSPLTKKLPFSIMITSRGCPFKCFYCNPINSGNYRSRNAKNIVDEMEQCYKKFGVKEIQFYDDTFTVNKKHVIDICNEILKRKIDIIWDCRTRVDLVNKELLMKMKKAGCEKIRFGVETGDPNLLGFVKKGVSNNNIEKAFQWSKEAEIDTLAYFMIGLPGETLKSINKTIDYSKKLGSTHVRFSVATAYPGTQMYNIALKNRIFKKDVWKNYTEGLMKREPNPVFESHEYSFEDLIEIAKKNSF